MVRPLVFIILPFLLLACDDAEEQKVVDTGPVVGPLELPVSLRSQDSAPTDAVRIEVSPKEYRVDGQTIINLTSGNIPDAEKSGTTISKLSQALMAGTARRVAALRLHANTPYETAALTLATLKAHNVVDAAFEVRPPNGGAETGYMMFQGFEVQPQGQDTMTPEDAARPWTDFVTNWEGIYESCRRDYYVDCDAVATKPAEDGNLEIRLFSRGQAMKLAFLRWGGEPVAEAMSTMELLEGMMADKETQDKIKLPPATAGIFTWKYEAATAEDSPISLAMRPLCGMTHCTAVVTGDKSTMMVRQLAFLGAAFPNGTQSPRVVFAIPEK